MKTATFITADFTSETHDDNELQGVYIVLGNEIYSKTDPDEEEYECDFGGGIVSGFELVSDDLLL